ncbi:MAG: hypothetical protein JXQ99_26200 [Hyphomicrobiaceae bacterium]
MSQLPEIRESDAAPEIAAIYADIKESAALPQINLIFRYFATKDGVLEWIWQALRPLYRSRELSAAANELTRSIERPGLSPLMAALTGDDLAACKFVIDSYNTANPQNLIALMALVRAIDRMTSPGDATVKLTPREAFATTRPTVAFPALPRRDSLSPDLLARVEKMTARHPGAPGAVPSMYLHLTLWPSALEAADIYLQPMIESPGWAPLVGSVIEQAEEIAVRLAPSIELSPHAPDAATLDETTTMIRVFVRQMIPELISVGRLLAVE